MISKLCFIRFFVVIATCYWRVLCAQQLIEGCSNSDSTCFSYPNNCHDTECRLVYKWTSSQDGVSNRFSITARVTPDLQLNSAWIAIGFSDDQAMGNDDIVLCKSTLNSFSVDHYFSLGEFTPSLMDSNNPRIGISNPSVLTNSDSIQCTFDRAKSMDSPKYFDLSRQNFYLFAAIGPLDSSGNLAKHTFKLSSRNPVDFSSRSTRVVESNSNDNHNNNTVKIKVHAAFMIVAWFILISIGVLIARYYKFIFPERRVYKLKIWFVLHRPIMLAAFVLSLVGFLVILSHENWKWVPTSDLTGFVHSIFGILTLGLAFLQIIVAIFRPHQEHQKRFIFNYFHRILGFSILISAIITLFIGVSMDHLNLKMKGIGVMIGWTLWIIIFIVLTEFIERQYKKKMYNLNLRYLSAQDFTNLHRKNNLVDQAQYHLESIKIILLFVHLVIAFGLGATLIYFVTSAQSD